MGQVLTKKQKNLWKAVKDELIRQSENPKYFTMIFFRQWMDYKKLVYADRPMADILTNFRRVIEPTAFYRKNSCAYCVFLEIMQQCEEDLKRLLLTD